jgi:hypothetical protein
LRFRAAFRRLLISFDFSISLSAEKRDYDLFFNTLSRAPPRQPAAWAIRCTVRRRALTAIGEGVGRVVLGVGLVEALDAEVGGQSDPDLDPLGRDADSLHASPEVPKRAPRGRK